MIQNPISLTAGIISAGIAFVLLIFLMIWNPFKLKNTWQGLYFSPIAGIFGALWDSKILTGVLVFLGSALLISFVAKFINKE